MSKEKEAENSTSLVSTPNRAILEPILRDLERLWEMRYWLSGPYFHDEYQFMAEHDVTD